MWANLAQELAGECIFRLGTSSIRSKQKKSLSTHLTRKQTPGNSSTSASLKVERLKEGLYWLERSGIEANFVTYASLLRQCADSRALSEGKRLHAHILKNGYGSDRFLANLLVHMYGNCRSLEDACAVFDRIRKPNIFSWNIMIAAYAHNGHVDDARRVFEKMAQRDVASWTTLIAAYSQNGHGKEALRLFSQMDSEGVKPNKLTFISVLDACASLAALTQGKKIHARIVDSGLELDMDVGNALVNMYGKCDSLLDGRRVFNELPQRNVVSWNTMMAAYAQNGHAKEALELFQLMDLEPDKITFISVLDACASLAALAPGKRIHASIVDTGLESDVVVGTALVNMYGKCGSLEDARSLFEKMPQRNVVSWTAMIAAYAQNGHGREALQFFQRMDMEGTKPDNFTFSCALDACASLAALAYGKGIHTSMVIGGFGSDVFLGNALVNMYGKCGSVNDARSVFDKMATRDVVSWNAMIGAYALNGHGKEALNVFWQMDMEGVKPDMVTFVCIFRACNHAGLLNDGWHYFISMSRDYGIAPTGEHYGCMIDLVGRAGQLNAAEDLINNMPLEPDTVSWMTLLGACKIHGDVEGGARAARHVFKLNPMYSPPYILLSNIYAAAGRQDDVANVRKAMRQRGIKKQLGYSCIEVNDKVHEFVVGDTSHPQKEELYAELQRLSSQMEEAGYMPDTKAVLHDVEEEEKEHMLCYHSEKLAISFGLISTAAGTPLRIINNLRVCSDCHTATKLISQTMGRNIIVRDDNRFHHFDHGVCSCGDYW